MANEDVDLDVSSNLDLPQLDYPQMIMAAVEGLNPEEGINITTISSYIESNYPDLPDAHSTLLSNALDKMQVTGELVFANNNYSKPETEQADQPKRGRGRPPKAKSSDEVASPTYVGPPRGRGRPPKSKSPGAAPAASLYTGPPRPRGRPPMVRDPLAPPTQLKKVSVPGVKRGRGRPPMARDPLAPKPQISKISASGVKRGRGRPPKAFNPFAPPPQTKQIPASGVKRGRGRPRKNT